jgi:hypothetical protein
MEGKELRDFSGPAELSENDENDPDKQRTCACYSSIPVVKINIIPVVDGKYSTLTMRRNHVS